jgi:hypothetical protein
VYVVKRFFIGMRKTAEEIRNMSDEELDAYINRPNPHPINKEKEHLHFNTKEECLNYYSDGMDFEDFVKKIRDEYLTQL